MPLGQAARRAWLVDRLVPTTLAEGLQRSGGRALTETRMVATPPQGLSGGFGVLRRPITPLRMCRPLIGMSGSSRELPQPISHVDERSSLDHSGARTVSGSCGDWTWPWTLRSFGSQPGSMTQPRSQRDTPVIVVLFSEVERPDVDLEEYDRASARMREIVASIPGFVSCNSMCPTKVKTWLSLVSTL